MARNSHRISRMTFSSSTTRMRAEVCSAARSSSGGPRSATAAPPSGTCETTDIDSVAGRRRVDAAGLVGLALLRLPLLLLGHELVALLVGDQLGPLRPARAVLLLLDERLVGEALRRDVLRLGQVGLGQLVPGLGGVGVLLVVAEELLEPGAPRLE